MRKNDQIAMLLSLGIIFAGAVSGFAGTPCCEVKGINSRTGVVSGVETATGRTFEFRFDPGNGVKGLKIGSPLAADFSAKSVKFGGRKFAITKINGAAAGAAQRYGITPCCAIRSVDMQKATLILVDNASGRTLQVKVKAAATIGRFSVGQKVFGTAARDAFSVDGIQPCCSALNP